MISKGRVLIVDDDALIVQTVSHLLHDEGFDTAFATNGHEAIEQVETIEPDVVLLELWLPRQDGMETLRRLRSESPETAVIMMSGYGSLKMAVKAMQLGAADYLEKPFANSDVLHTVQRALLQRQVKPKAHVRSFRTMPLNGTARRNGTMGTALRPTATSRGMCDAPLQRTLCRSAVLQGQGLQSGSKTGLVLDPLPPHQGIVFRDLMTREHLPADVRWVDSTQFCTSLLKGSVKANTIEHLMSALHAYQITNVLITLGDEVPFMDGSALAFCEQIEASGIVEQEALAECFVVDRCYLNGSAASEEKSILIEPFDGLRVTYRASYPAPIGTQEWTYEHHSGAYYRQELAPARTFGFVKDVEAMHDAGLIPGGRMNNTILLSDGCMVNTAPLRFPNEFVRHKIRDIMGVFYLLGQPIRVHIRANMTGHTDNIVLVRQLQTALTAV
jgi:UDP-3-O-acyl N-acetylglucosamine deacetylase